MSSTATRPAIFVACVALLAGPSGCVPSQPVEPAGLVLRGGVVATVDDALPEAQAIAVDGHEILAVGSDAEIDAYIGPDTEVIDLEGRLAIPGFIEGHGHFMSMGWTETILDLTGVETWDEIVELVGRAARAAEPGDWIFGWGWHQEKWSNVPEPNVDGVPLHRDLSEVSPENPVSLSHASGHATLVNAAALELAGIDANTPDPAGGTIVRDERGDPTGLLREAAENLITARVDEWQERRSPEERAAEARRTLEAAGRDALSKGITSFHDAGSSFEQIDQFRAWDEEGVLPVRLYVMVGWDETNETLADRLADYRIVPDGNDFLAVRSIKRLFDGALGSHGAWLLEPYSDLPSTTGLVLDEPSSVEATARLAIRHGFQLNTHAIGDRANREALGIYKRVLEGHPEAGDLRWRIEHAQHIHPDDVPLFARLGVIASMQGIGCTSDGPWLPLRLGEQRAGETSYVWRSLIDSGAVVTNGTDAPVEDVDPLPSFYASVARRLSNGEVFHPEQSMTRMEALRSYTINNAYAAFEEHLKGSITPGKLADIAVLSKNILTIPEEEILTARVDYTIVGGEVRYRRR